MAICIKNDSSLLSGRHFGIYELLIEMTSANPQIADCSASIQPDYNPALIGSSSTTHDCDAVSGSQQVTLAAAPLLLVPHTKGCGAGLTGS